MYVRVNASLGQLDLTIQNLKLPFERDTLDFRDGFSLCFGEDTRAPERTAPAAAQHALDVRRLGPMSEYSCEQCWSSEASEAWKAVTSIPIQAHLIDESHYIVSIRLCPSCSQHYLQVTTETVDWKDGEDPIYRTIIPIDDAERTALTSSKLLDNNVIERIGVGRQSLKFDWPKNQEPSTYWDTGVRVGVHD